MGGFRRQTYKIKEQSNLRKGSKDYLRIFNQNNLITKIDSFVDEKIDVVYLALYEDETRYLFPFSSNGGFYPTYKYVTRYKDGHKQYGIKIGVLSLYYRLLARN